MTASADLGAYIEELGKLWCHPGWYCHLDYPSNFQKKDCVFDSDWLSDQVQNQFRLPEQELTALCKFISSFLNSAQGAASGRNRPPMAAPLAILVLALVELFGSRLVLGTGVCRKIKLVDLVKNALNKTQQI